MKPFLLLSTLCLVISTAGPTVAQSSQAATPPPSLGEIARKLKANRTATGQKPGLLFTNDNMPTRPLEEGPTVAGGGSAGPAATAGATGEGAPGGGQQGAKTGATESSTATATEGHGEKYYRAKMKEFQVKLEMHQRQLDVLQQKTSQNQLQYYPDPNKTLAQEYTRSDVNKKTLDIEKKKQEIAADEKTINDLRDELRREGGSPGWLR